MANNVSLVDASWLPEKQKSSYASIGGASGLFRMVASGKSLIDIQREHGIDAELVILQSSVNEEFGAMLAEAMRIRETHTAEQIHDLANTYQGMYEEQMKALESQDLEKLALLQEAHKEMQTALKNKGNMLIYLDTKYRADRIAKAGQSSFAQMIDEIVDVEAK